jgi:hypothetical protein
MNKKYFDFIEKKELTKKEIKENETFRQTKLKAHSKKIQKLSLNKTKQKVDLKFVPGRVIISIDLDGKNSHTFSNGSKIYIGRQYNNLNRRETEPVNAFVVSAEKIPNDSQILIHPNSIIDSNKIFGFKEDITTVRYYSIPENECYLWKSEKNEWQPLKGFATALRIFNEYKGTMIGVDNELIKNVLYITSGELKGKVVHTLKACDYEIIFMGEAGVEEKVIRCRHFENEINEREEIVGIDHALTKKVLNGDLLIGISSIDAKSIIFTPQS